MRVMYNARHKPDFYLCIWQNSNGCNLLVRSTTEEENTEQIQYYNISSQDQSWASFPSSHDSYPHIPHHLFLVNAQFLFYF